MKLSTRSRSKCCTFSLCLLLLGVFSSSCYGLPQPSSTVITEDSLQQGSAPSIESASEEQSLAQRAAALWDAKAYFELVQLGTANAALLLSLENRDYYTTVIIAHAGLHSGQYAAALPFYEAALRLHARVDTLWHYQTCVQNSGQYAHAVQVYGELATRYPALATDIEGLQTVCVFCMSVLDGDSVFAVNRQEAYLHYTQALRLYEQLPDRPEMRSRWKAALGSAATDMDYTHWQLFRDDDAWKRYYYEQPVELFAKLSLTEALAPNLTFSSAPTARRALRYAAVIIRQTDYTYTLADGRSFAEKEYLDDESLAEIRFAWGLVEELVYQHTQGMLSVKTEWIEAAGSTLVGLKTGQYKDLFETVHFDPSAVQPLPVEVYRHISSNYDGVVFVWPRGSSSKQYGGGRVILPGTDGRRVLNYIGSIVDSPRINLHEFLHAFEPDQEASFRVHGPSIGKIPEDFNGQTEMDWLLYVLSKMSL